jgi:hypothetical protein
MAAGEHAAHGVPHPLPVAAARDPAFQDRLMDRLAALTGVALF